MVVDQWKGAMELSQAQMQLVHDKFKALAAGPTGFEVIFQQDTSPYGHGYARTDSAIGARFAAANQVCVDVSNSLREGKLQEYLPQDLQMALGVVFTAEARAF